MLRSAIYYIVFGIILLLLMVDVFPAMSIHGQIPDIILIFVVFIAEKKGSMQGQITGFVLGLFLDLFSGQLIGIGAATKLTIGLTMGVFHNRFMISDLKIQFLVIGIASLLQMFVNFIFLKIFSITHLFLYIQTHWIQAFITILIAPIIMLILEFFSGMVERV